MNKKVKPFCKLVIPSAPSEVEKRDFLIILNKANTEAPLQGYLSRHPTFFIRMLPYGRQAEIYDRPKLGSEYIPDFLLNIENSQGKCWACIELESPIHSPLTEKGNISAKLNEAFGQINDWREWLKNNIAYAQKELALKEINSDLNTWIIIGRRQNFNERQKRRYVALKNLGINILSYDRLLD